MPTEKQTSGFDTPAKLPKDAKRSLGMMLDFELPITISLAHTTLALCDVLKLTTGSVLELNRSLNEPADVVVNGRVVAQGEIVVVEGNYGIRIQKINDQARDAASFFDPGD